MSATMTKKRLLTQKVTTDYPRQNDKISSVCYTIRLSAPQGVKKAEVSIDQGDWLPCREAIGHWWYDWSGYSDGEHEVVARITLQDGNVIRSEPCEFFVIPQPKPIAK